MAEHVGAELQLEAVGGFKTFRLRHDASVVDKNVDGASLGKFPLRKLTHGREGREIENRQFGASSGRIAVETGYLGGLFTPPEVPRGRYRVF
jgi:hypothetical protein